MNKYNIAKEIENFAPLLSQEEWDCSGWGIDVEGYNDIKKIMLCLTVTDDIICQARENNCDMIISHHPLFYVPLNWKGINIYCAHTNLDKANGGTTDTLIKILLENGLDKYCAAPAKIIKAPDNDFLRILQLEMPIEVLNFSQIIKIISPNARLINNHNKTELQKLAFCAGSGSEFIKDSQNIGADCLITGDLKFHTALDSPIVIYDIGHFESEHPVLPVFEKLIGDKVKCIYAKEKSPFIKI